MVVTQWLRWSRVGLLVAIALVAALWSAPGAGAFEGNPPKTSPPSSGSSSGSSGSPVQTTVKTCSLYATSSRFGLSCITGGGAGNAKTIRQILGKKESLPSCWDVVISDSDLATEYNYAPNPEAPYYVLTCITGLDENRSPASQPNAHINQYVIEIPKTAPRCYNYDEAKQKATPFTADQLLHCLATLTTKQQQTVSATSGNDTQIPGIVIAPQPSSRVRTLEDVAFVDTANTQGSNPTRTPDLTVGGVTLWATMDRFTIYPYGPNGGTSKTCNGTTPVSSDDTPQTRPDACWFQYPRSSADQAGMVYPFRAEADWTVHYRADGIDHVLASFKKYNDIKLPVYDIQTLVVR